MEDGVAFETRVLYYIGEDGWSTPESDLFFSLDDATAARTNRESVIFKVQALIAWESAKEVEKDG